MPQVKSTKPKFRFRLMRGIHRKGAIRDERGHVVEEGKNFKPGEIIETDVNLAELFPSQPPKFVRIDEIVEQETQMTDVYKKMSLQELKSLAEEQEIDLTGITKKEEIINLLLQAG